MSKEELAMRSAIGEKQTTISLALRYIALRNIHRIGGFFGCGGGTWGWENNRWRTVGINSFILLIGSSFLDFLLSISSGYSALPCRSGMLSMLSRNRLLQ
jgi:hypothetical protein